MKLALIDDWFAQWWKLASTRVTMILTTIAVVLSTNPDMWKAVIDVLPAPVQPFAPLLAVLIASIAQGSARMVSFRAGE